MPKDRSIPSTEQLVASQKVSVIKALAMQGLAPDPVVAAALFEIGTELLVLEGIAPEALLSRLHYLVLRVRQHHPQPSTH